jgi:hypothetical protein
VCHSKSAFAATAPIIAKLAALTDLVPNIGMVSIGGTKTFSKLSVSSASTSAGGSAQTQGSGCSAASAGSALREADAKSAI